jgi:Calcium-dependent channel, 7TM region, putative phosphate
VKSSDFFSSYVIVSGGLQIFFRLSQLHTLLKVWITERTVTTEALSQRRLDKMNTQLKTFHLDEFYPLFLFIFMVSVLYGTLSPISNVCVALFYKCAYKVFKYMTVFLYGNGYAGGGFLFYTLNQFLFAILYFMIFLICGYISLNGGGVMAGTLSCLIFVVYGVQSAIHDTFVAPSRTLSLTKARLSDATEETRTPYQKRLDDFLHAKAALDNFSDGRDGGRQDNAVAWLDRRYDPESASDGGISGTGSIHGNHHLDKGDFAYRQPSLNHSTWEVAPRPYRDNDHTHEHLYRPEDDINYW